MKATKKITFLIMLSVIMLMLIPTFAFAKENDNVKIVQLTLTDNSIIDIVKDKNVQSSEGNLSEGGKYSYNSDTSTLTLTDTNLYKIHVRADNFTIKFAGNNTITSKEDEWPIELENTFTKDVPGNTTIDIENNAILNVNGKASVHPIITAHTNLTINNKGNFISDGSNGHIISSKEGLKLYGGNYNINNNGTPIIYGLKDILIQNVNLVAKGINGNFIDSDKNLTIIGGKYILEANKYNAIYSREDIVISGASLTATTNDKEANAIAGKKIVISDNASVVAKAPNSKSWPALFGDNEITITNSQVNAESAGDVGIFSKGTVSITNRSNVDATGYWSAIRGNTGVKISDSIVNAKSSDDVGIFSPDTVSITEGSKVDATGYWPAIRGNTGVVISDSEVGAESNNDVAIFAETGNITLNQAKIIAKSLPRYENTLYAPKGSVTIDGYVKNPDEIHADYITLADYKKVEEQEKLIPQELKDYTKESVDALNVVKNNIKRDLDFRHQKEVNKMATELENAIKGLKLKPADYSKVRKQLDLIPVDLDNYSDESVKALKDIKDNINYNLDFKHQSEVDKIEKNLEKAISNLKHKTVKLVVNNLEGTTSTPNGEIVVNRGSDNEITISAKHGYKLTSVKVNDIEKIKELKDGKLKLENVIEDKNIVITAEKIVYEVLDGANQEYVVNENKEATFRISGELELFDKVYVDNTEVDKSNYTLAKGSTIITFKDDFIKSLGEGEHILKVAYTDGGEATTKFNVAEKENTTTGETDKKEEKKNKNPQTSDNIAIYFTLLGLGVIGMVSGLVYLKKKY